MQEKFRDSHGPK